MVSDPVPWSYVPPGAIVLIGDVPRTVVDNVPWPTLGLRIVYIEAWPPLTLADTDTVQLVTLGEAEALGHLHGAGLTTEIIEIQE